jgi:hypothetical protein
MKTQDLIAEQKWDQCVDIGSAAVEPLIHALQNGDGDMQKGAIETLRRIGDARAVEPLITLLKKSSNEDVRRSAADALKWLYHNGKLEETHKQSIITLKGQTLSHQDYMGSHTDEETHYDCDSWGNTYHDDSTTPHTDNEKRFEI